MGVEYPVAMTGAALDASATVTRNPQAAGHSFLKEAGILTTSTAAGAMMQPMALVNGTISGAQDILRTTAKGVADVVADGVGLVDKEAGLKVQENVNMVDGGIIALNTADNLARGVLTATPAIATMASPLLNDDLRGAAVEKITQKIEQEPDEKIKQMGQAMVKDVEPLVDMVRDTAQNMTASKLKETLAALSHTVSSAEKKALDTPTTSPRYEPSSEGRAAIKDLVQHSEIIRNRNNSR